MMETITAELRKRGTRYTNVDDKDVVRFYDDDFDYLCDSIDSIHASLERENAELRKELDLALDDVEDETNIGSVVVTVTPRIDWSSFNEDMRGVMRLLSDLCEEGDKCEG